MFIIIIVGHQQSMVSIPSYHQPEQEACMELIQKYTRMQQMHPVPMEYTLISPPIPQVPAIHTEYTHTLKMMVPEIIGRVISQMEMYTLGMMCVLAGQLMFRDT